MAQLSRRRTKSTVFLSPQNREIINNSGKTVQKFFEDLIDFCSDLDIFSWKDGQFFFRHARIVIVRSDFLNNLCDALPQMKTGDFKRTDLIRLQGESPR